MIHYSKYQTFSGEILGKRKKFDNTIYSFDIETTSCYILNNKVYSSYDYLKLNEKECEFRAFMYIWMFSINDTVYYGRTWEDFKAFITKLDEDVPYLKTVYVHNLSFEFQFLKSHFDFMNTVARKKHKVMSTEMFNYNIIFKCSLFLSNVSLAKLSDVYNLPVKKLEGDLDYSLIRTPATSLTDKELAYCENDCLVLYHYIKTELSIYKEMKKIPLTSTGHVRKELRDVVQKNYKYKQKVRKAINTNPHVYNLLIDSFMGGYTHSNCFYTDEVLKNIDSFDFTSSYPYVMTTHKFPSSEFKKCILTDMKFMSDRFAYILKVRFENVKCRYNNTFISASKCHTISGARYDNGRIIQADYLEITLTDIDFKFILKAYDCTYEILESYYSVYRYLPKTYINFILDKYVIKTTYKGIPEKELEYQLEKGKFNALYGMTVTNTIKDEVKYDNVLGWSEIELSNEEIVEKLIKEKEKGFLSFSYGVWVTAHARNNLLENVLKLDEYVVYCDTDSIKLREGYNKKVIEDYNKKVENIVKKASQDLEIPYNRYEPVDIKGNKRLLGVFDKDGTYDKFITQGAKKYAVEVNNKISITVAGVPKRGCKSLKSLDDFRDDFVFDFEETNKLSLCYIDEQPEFKVVDYQNKEYLVTDKSGSCLFPTTYVLGKALEYSELISDFSSKRAKFKE